MTPREQTIADSAAKILAEAQSLSTPSRASSIEESSVPSEFSYSEDDIQKYIAQARNESPARATQRPASNGKKKTIRDNFSEPPPVLTKTKYSFSEDDIQKIIDQATKDSPRAGTPRQASSGESKTPRGNGIQPNTGPSKTAYSDVTKRVIKQAKDESPGRAATPKQANISKNKMTSGNRGQQFPEPKSAYSFSDDAIQKILDLAKNEPDGVTAQRQAKSGKNNKTSNHIKNKGSEASPVYFFTEGMSPDPDLARVGSMVSATSSITEESTSSKDHIGESKPATSTKKTNVKSPEQEGPSADEIIEKIAMDLFPATDGHYKLLVALAEHPNGMTWEEINAFIPKFALFVEKHASANNIQAIKPTDVLEACVSITRKKDRNSDLFFIHAPKLQSTESSNEDDEASATCELTEASSTASSSSAAGKLPLSLSFAFEGSDVRAAVCFLQILKLSFDDRPWPTTKGQVLEFLGRLELLLQSRKTPTFPEMQTFHAWLETLDNADHSDAVSRRGGKALQLILGQLHNWKCVTNNGFDLHWEQRMISDVLQHTEPRPCQQRLYQALGSNPIFSIETSEQLMLARDAEPFRRNRGDKSTQSPVSVMCEGVPEELYVIAVRTESITYIFDCVRLGAKAVCRVLSSLLADECTTKTFHDVHYCAGAIAKHGGIKEQIKGVLDTQLAMEYLTGLPSMSFDKMLLQLGINPPPSSSSIHIKNELAEDRESVFSERPFRQGLLTHVADQITLLAGAKKTLFENLQKDKPARHVWNVIQKASDCRAAFAMEKDGKRQMCFDKANANALTSLELLQAARPTDILVMAPISVSSDVASILSLLPKDLLKSLSDTMPFVQLTDIILDAGRPAMASFGDHRRVCFGSKKRLVTPADLQNIAQKVEGHFENDNRAGIKNQLHCIYASRNRQLDLTGLAFRVGRQISGAATMISDLLFSDLTRSILLIGESRCGKVSPSLVCEKAVRLLRRT